LQVAQDQVPEFDGNLIVVAAEGEVPDHLEAGQVRAIANEIKVVGANARLQRAVTPAIRLMEAAFDPLHARADKKSRIVVRNDIAVHDQRKAELLKSSLDHV
jgi:hypothetical protein